MSNRPLKPTRSAPGLPAKRNLNVTAKGTKSDIKVPNTAIPKAGKKQIQKRNSERASEVRKGQIRALLALTPQEKKARASTSKRIRNLLWQKHEATSVASIDSNEDLKEKIIVYKRYKRPVEKLLKRLKTVRREEIPSDVNIHRRRFRRSSFIGAPGVRKEVELIHERFVKHKRKVQPQVGFNYTKNERRLLLGFRHRKLSNAWHYFGSFKEYFSRGIKPNSHVPDAIFFIMNLMIFISTGFTFGFIFANNGFIHLLEDLYEYELFRKNQHQVAHEGRIFWQANASFDYYEDCYYMVTIFMFISQILGFVGVYVADQRMHLAYIITMLMSLLSEAIVAASAVDDSCSNVSTILDRLVRLLVENYYEKIEARDVDGNPVLDSSGEIVKIRTYKAANLMDGIQVNLHCCGAYGIDDYTSTNVRVPPSCCTPLWNLNPHCANVVPTDKLEYRAKFQIAENMNLGCLKVLDTMCRNLQRMMGPSSSKFNAAKWCFFIVALVPLIFQARQIRQLKRWPNLRISAGSISQSLQASAGNEGIKTGGGGVRAVVEATKFTEKQQERLQQTRREALLQGFEPEEESSESTENSSGELPVHTVNFGQLKNLQQFVDTEDKTKLEMPYLDKTVEGFAGRFNILANKSLQNYVSGIFSTTYQNETNAGLEAIAQTLERQFAQHTTDYNWRKLLTKPKGKVPLAVTKVAQSKHADVAETESETEQDSDDS